MPNPGGQRKAFGELQQLLVPVTTLGASSPPLPPSFAASNGVVALDSSSERWSDGSDFSLSSVSSTTPSVVSFTSSMPHTVPQSPAMNAFDDHSQSTIQEADRTLPSDQTFSLLRYLTHISPASRPARSSSQGITLAPAEAPTPQQQSELAEPSTVIAAPAPFVPLASLTQSGEASPVIGAASVAVDRLSEDLVAFSMKEGPSSSLSTPTASPLNHHSGKQLLDNTQEEPQSQSSAGPAQGNSYQWLNHTRYQGNPFFGVGEYPPNFPTHHTYSDSQSSASFATAPAATPLSIDLSPPAPQSQSTMVLSSDAELPSLTGSVTESDTSTDLTSLASTIVPVYHGIGRQHPTTSSLSEIPEDDFTPKNIVVASADATPEPVPLYGNDLPSYHPVYNADTISAPPLMPPPKLEPFDYVEENSEIILPVGLPPSSVEAQASAVSNDDATHDHHAASSPQQHLQSAPSHSTDRNVQRPEPLVIVQAPPRPPRLETELCSLFSGPVQETPSSDVDVQSHSTTQQQADLDDPYWRIRAPPRLPNCHTVPFTLQPPAFWGIPEAAAPSDSQPSAEPVSATTSQQQANLDDPYWAVRDPYRAVRKHAAPCDRVSVPLTRGSTPEGAATTVSQPSVSEPPSTIASTTNQHQASSYDPYRAFRDPVSVPVSTKPPTSVRRRSICRYGLYDDTSSESGSDSTGVVEGYRMHAASAKGKARAQEEQAEGQRTRVSAVEPSGFTEGSKGKGKEMAVLDNSSPSKPKQENEAPIVQSHSINTATLQQTSRKPSLSWDARTWVYSPVQHGGESESMVDSVFSNGRRGSNPTSVRTLDQWVSEVTLYQAKIPSFGGCNGLEQSRPDSWSISPVHAPACAWVESPKPQPLQQAVPSYMDIPSPTLPSVVTFVPSALTTPTTTTTTAPPSMSTASPVECFTSRTASPVQSPSPSRSPAPTVSFKLPHEDLSAGASRETKDRPSYSNAPSTYPVTPLAPLGDCLNFAADGIRPRPSKSNSLGHTAGGSNDYTRRWYNAPAPAFDATQVNNGNMGPNMGTPSWYQNPAQVWQTPQTPWMNPFAKVSPPTAMPFGYGPPSMGLPPPVAPMMGPNLPLPPSTSSLPTRTTTLPFHSAGIPTYPLPQQTGTFGMQTPYMPPVQVSPPQMQQPAQPPFTTPAMGPVPATAFPHGPRWGMSLHSRFCFPDANVAFLVQNVEYRVHRYFFEQHSNFFRELFASYPAHHTEPIPLVANARDFGRLLSLFYPSDLSEPDINSVEEWTSILSLATTWSFTQLRKRAINTLMTKANAVQRISISRQYNVKELAYAGYEELCMRSQPVPLQDAEELGLKTVLKIWEAQQDLMKVGFCRMHCCKAYVEYTIKKKFELE